MKDLARDVSFIQIKAPNTVAIISKLSWANMVFDVR